MKIIRFIVDVPIVRHSRQLPKGAEFFIKKSSSRVHVDRWLAERKIHEVTEPMKSLGTAGNGSKKTAGQRIEVNAAIASVDQTLRAAIAAAGVKDEAAFKRLPREEQNAFLAQAQGQARPEARAAAGRSQEIPLAQIVRSKTNREHFDPEKMAELVESVRTHGVMEPIIVRPQTQGLVHGENAADRYEIVMGERRWRAAQEAKLTTIPAIIRELDDRTALEWQLTENLQREDLRPMDEARGYKQLVELGYSVEEVSAKLHRSPATIYARMKLLALPEVAAAAVEQGKLSASHADLLATVDDANEQSKLATEWMQPRTDTYDGAPLTISVRDAGVAVKEVKRKLDEARQWDEDTAKYREEGFKILTLQQSTRVFNYGRLAESYVGVNDECDRDPQKRTWKALLTRVGEDGKVIVAYNSFASNRVRLVYARKAAEAALEQGGLIKARPEQVSPAEARRVEGGKRETER